MRRHAARIAACAVSLALAMPLWAAERVAVELNDGSRIEGEVLKKDARVLYLGVGEQVITIDRSQVKDLKTVAGDEEVLKDVRDFALYKTAKRPVKSVAALAEELGPAIVIVKTPSGLGTGWFCDPAGYLVTNQHVVADEQSITVTVYKREDGRFEKKVFKKVRLVALDQQMDLALLKIDEEIELHIPQLYIGDSTAVKEGDEVFTIGNPLGLERSTSVGTVSKVNRNFEGRLYVQTTAPISPGNSGGPLFNDRGEVIGVTNMGYAYMDGLNFAVPSVYIREFLDNVEAFAYDPDNPNTGVKYMEAPVTATDGSIRFTANDFIKVGHGVSSLALADVNGDGVKEVVFVNNNKGEIGVLRRRRPGEEDTQADDFEDINRLPGSERFAVDTHAVNNRIASIAVADMNDDGRPDVVFYGDIDGLAVLTQAEDGTFGTPERISDFEVSRRIDALRVADLDGDGDVEVFALGTKEFAVFGEEGEPRIFALDAAQRDRIIEFDLGDLNGDGRLDLVLFAADKFYAVSTLMQNADGDFVKGQQLASHLSGPVKPYKPGRPGMRFITLDKGQNRLRELLLETEEQPVQDRRINVAIEEIPLEAGTNADDVALADLDGDGSQEIVTADTDENEFLIFGNENGGYTVRRSPAPKAVTGLRLYQDERGRAVLFCLSAEDKIFGVSRVGRDAVAFPRPVNTEGTVQFLWLGEVVPGQQTLLWVEKRDRSYVVQTAPAAALLEKAYADDKGSIDVEAASLAFAGPGAEPTPLLKQKPDRLAFADFNTDGQPDVLAHWSYSGKESLYLGKGEGRFEEIIAEQEFLDEIEDQPLLLADIDGDGTADVLLVQPGFVRVLKVDEKGKLYVERQFNWHLDEVERLVEYSAGPPARFLALAGETAHVVEFDAENADFRLIGRIDLAGLGAGDVKAGDLDGNGTTDLLLLGGNAIRILYRRNDRLAARPT
jgi:serine protease Do